MMNKPSSKYTVFLSELETLGEEEVIKRIVQKTYPEESWKYKTAQRFLEGKRYRDLEGMLIQMQDLLSDIVDVLMDIKDALKK